MNIANPIVKKYYLSHKQEIFETHQQYAQQNPDKIARINKTYYDKNKFLKTTCECGCEINRLDISRHRKTLKHFELIKNISHPEMS